MSAARIATASAWPDPVPTGAASPGRCLLVQRRIDYPNASYNRVIEPNMTICVETHISEEDGREGIKLEQHCVVTESGRELLSRCPFEGDLPGELHGTGYARFLLIS